MKKHSFILRKAGSFGSMTTVSRVLGLIREMVFARFFGTSIFADAFITAFVFPNLFRKLFGEGAFSGSFIPIFSDYFEKDKKSAWRLLNTILSMLTLFLLILTVFVLLILSFAHPSVEAERISYIIHLSRIMFPYVILVCTIGFLFGIFNYFGHYALPGLSSVILNIVLILGIWISAVTLKGPYHQVLVLAWLVLLCGVLQWLFFVPLIFRLKIPLRFSLAFHHPGISHFFRLYLPSVFAVSIMQINVLFDKIIAVISGPGGPSVLNYANRIYQLPLGVFAVSIALAALPEFSRSSSQKDEKGLSEKILYSLKLSLFIALPSSIGLIVLSRPIVAALFERGAFTQNDTIVTAIVLSCYSLGIFAFANLKTLTYAFYALKDSMTPTKIAFFCMILNIVLNIIFMLIIGVAGIALATSIATGVNVFFLLIILGKKLKYNFIHDFIKLTGKYLLMSLGMGTCTILIYKISDFYLKNVTGGALVSLTVSVVTGILVYGILTYFFARKDMRFFSGR
ncbi:MAG: murein biosynthesis integral membrane protein MurJ [Candidatus Aureabacteria bacterium]|nr:murein biosynthesis integral membrane protein MurJ [Candidatus Auribacterota bacterium]